MRKIILKNKKLVSEKVALMIKEEIDKNPQTILGLATGKTMIPLYKEIVKLYNQGKIDFSKARTFNLDEYCGLDKNSKDSYYYFMKKHLFNKINIKDENIFFPTRNVKRFEKEIKNSGGIRLQILGVGINGHIGFNEPGSDFKSKTRVVDLTKSTRKVNSRWFFSKKAVPKQAVTMGISTILNAKKIVLVATGKDKSKIIREIFSLDSTKKIPATALNSHKNVLCFLDKSASSKLI